MDWRTPMVTGWGATREFFAYSGKVQARAIRDTWEYMGRHYLSWEATLSVAAGAWLAVTGPWEGIVERFAAGVSSGLAILSVAILIHYVARLLVAPALIHRDQENELALHVPRVPPSAPRGFIDFEVDISENISTGRLTRLIARLAKEAERIADKIEQRSPKITAGNRPRVRLRASKYLAKRMMASARRVRRIHANLLKYSVMFEETWTGYSPVFFANAAEEERSRLYDAMTSALAGVTGYRNSVVSVRKTFQGETKTLQQDIWIACDLSDRVYKNLEDTLNSIIRTIRTALSPLDETGSPREITRVESRGKGKGRKKPR